MAAQISDFEQFNIITLIPCELESDEENELNNSQDSIASSDLADSSDDETITVTEIKPFNEIKKKIEKDQNLAKSIYINC